MIENNIKVCTIGHEVPVPGRPGKFRKFNPGEFYPADEIEEKYSAPITDALRKAKIVEVMKRILVKGRGLGRDGKPDVDDISRSAKVKLTAKERDTILKEITGEKEGGNDE